MHIGNILEGKNAMSFAEKLRRRIKLLGMFNFSGSANMLEVLAVCGFDFVIIDTEHSLYGLEQAATLVRSAQAFKIIPLIRVCENNAALIMKALDMGAEGVVVPHVNNSEDAMRALRAAWFPPDGNRGMCPDVRAARYDLNHWLNYAQTVRSDISIIPLIEEGDGVRNIDEIINVDGINAVFFGPADYTCSMSETVGKGFADDTMSEARVALEKVCKVAEKRNVSVMATPLIHLTDPAGANKNLIEMGVNIIVYATDTMVFHEVCQKIADAFRNRVR